MRRPLPRVLYGILLAAAAPACAAAAPPATATLHYLIDTVAGSSRIGDGGPATAAVLSLPAGIAADRDGNLYIADTGNHRVRKVAPDGIITTVAGTGRPGMSGDGGPATEARLNQPYGLALDPQGRLYIADFGNHRVCRVDPDGVISTVAGTGEKGTLGDDGPAAGAQLMSPRNLALDAAGNLYISEFDGHRVRKVDAAGRISTFAGIGVAGFGGDGGPAAKAQLYRPAGLAVDASGALYIADSQNHRVRRVGPNGAITTRLGGDDAASLYTPTGLAIDAAGYLYVAQRGTMLYTFGPLGRADAVETRDPQSAGTIADVTLDGRGQAYFIDGGRIRRMDAATDALATVAGDGYMIAAGDYGPAADALLREPRGVALDVAGNLFIADAGTHRIRKVARGGAITTWAGTGRPGFTGDGGPAALATLNSPTSLATEPGGSLLVADTGNHRIRRIAPAGAIHTVAGNGDNSPLGPEGAPALLIPLHSPAAAIFDPGGAIYVADTNHDHVLAVSSAGNATTAAGNATAGDSGDGGLARLAQIHGPAALAFDAAGNLYIADSLNHRVRKVDPAGVIATVAGAGVRGYSGDGGPGVEAHLNDPRGLAVDGDGNVYIADTGNHAVRKLTAAGVIHTIAGTGAPGAEGDGGAASEATLNMPWGMALDGSGNLYIADSGNRRIRKLAPFSPPDEVELISPAAVLNAASLAPGPVAPGAMVALLAEGIGEGETRVLFDDLPAPVVAAAPGRVDAQAPYEIAGRAVVRIEVRRDGRTRARADAQVAEATPGIYTATGGTGQALALNEDGGLNTAANPVPRGALVTIFATGVGRLDPPAAAGLPAAPPYGKAVLPIAVRIGGYDAEIVWAGAAPGLVGVFQVNARVPAGFVPPGALAVELSAGTAASQPGVFVMVK